MAMRRSRASAQPTAANTESCAEGSILFTRRPKCQRARALAWDRQRVVRRRDANAAAGEMRVEQRAECIDAVSIECRQRLIEHPQRTPDEPQPRKPDPPP